MSRQEDARLAALRLFCAAVEGGATKEIAAEMAIDQYHLLGHPVPESEIRSALAHDLAELRVSQRRPRALR